MKEVEPAGGDEEEERSKDGRWQNEHMGKKLGSCPSTEREALSGWAHTYSSKTPCLSQMGLVPVSGTAAFLFLRSRQKKQMLLLAERLCRRTRSSW